MNKSCCYCGSVNIVKNGRTYTEAAVALLQTGARGFIRPSLVAADAQPQLTCHECDELGFKANKQWLWVAQDSRNRQIVALHLGVRGTAGAVGERARALQAAGHVLHRRVGGLQTGDTRGKACGRRQKGRHLPRREALLHPQAEVRASSQKVPLLLQKDVQAYLFLFYKFEGNCIINCYILMMLYYIYHMFYRFA